MFILLVEEDSQRAVSPLHTMPAPGPALVNNPGDHQPLPFRAQRAKHLQVPVATSAAPGIAKAV